MKARKGLVMPGVLRQSLASWCEAHGFTVLCILSPGRERFVVGPLPPQTPSTQIDDPSSFKSMSEAELRVHLRHMRLSEGEIEEAVRLSREWATTITGSGLALWPTAD